MPLAVTEIAILPIASTTTIEDISTKAGETWASLQETTRNAPGCQSLYWSRWVEDKEMVQLMINWESLEAHQGFRATPDFPAFEQRFVSLMNGRPSMYHAPLVPPQSAIKVFMAPTVEIVTMYCSSEISEGEKKKCSQNFETFLKQLMVDAEGIVAEVNGWVIEQTDFKDEKALAFVCCIGWESIEKHVAHRQTKSFMETIHLLRSGTIGSEMHHVKFDEH